MSQMWQTFFPISLRLTSMWTITTTEEAMCAESVAKWCWCERASWSILIFDRKETRPSWLTTYSDWGRASYATTPGLRSTGSLWWRRRARSSTTSTTSMWTSSRQPGRHNGLPWRPHFCTKLSKFKTKCKELFGCKWVHQFKFGLHWMARDILMSV